MVIELSNVFCNETAEFTNLTAAQVKTDCGLFIAESENVIRAALEAGCIPVKMLLEKRHIEGKAAALVNELSSIPTYTAPDSELKRLTGYELHRGILCAFKRPEVLNSESVLTNSRRVCVLESLTDTTNVGAIFRSAAALGIDAVMLTKDCCDPYSRRSLRVSMGGIFRVPFAYLPDDWIRMLKEKGFTSCALALNNDSISIDNSILKKVPKLALILGSEGNGLKEETINGCDYTALIPMSAGMDSLNVAAAAAVAFWETGRR